MSAAAWLVRLGPAAIDARTRLICLPHAGGGSTAFLPWTQAFGPRVEVLAVRLPGRETRLREAPLRSVGAIVDALAGAVAALDDTPLVLFGHSFGALLAFALAGRLQREDGQRPKALIVSGRAAPHLPSRAPALAHLPRRDVVMRVAQLYSGIPRVLLDDADYVATLGVALQADLEAIEQHRYSARPPLDCPIAAYGGAADPLVSRRELDAWSIHTRAAFVCDQFAGHHFYLHAAPGWNALRAAITQSLAGAVIDAGAAPCATGREG